MDPRDREFHKSYKPFWGPEAILMYAIPGKVGNSKNKSAQTNPIIHDQGSAIVSQGKDIRLAKFTAPRHVSALCLPGNQIYQHMLTHCLAHSGNSQLSTSSHQLRWGPGCPNGRGTADSFQRHRNARST